MSQNGNNPENTPENNPENNLESSQSLPVRDFLPGVKENAMETVQSIIGSPAPKKVRHNKIRELKEYCQYKRDLHYICSKYYEMWQYRFQIPSIIITSLSSTVSFFSISSVFSEESVRFLSLLVGVFASGAALAQTINKIFNFEHKATSHSLAVLSYDQILTKIRFMMLKENSDSQMNIEMIERLIFELKERVPYVTPKWTEEIYEKNKHKIQLETIQREKESMLTQNKFREVVDVENLKLELFEKELKEIGTFDDLKNKIKINIK